MKKSYQVMFFLLLLIPLYYGGIIWLERTANKGYADAQNDLALRYQHGHGVSQDYVKAANWFTKAANQGYAAAQYDLARMYAAGTGVVQDYRLALNWHTKAAYQGYARSLYEIALIHEAGHGVEKNLINAHMFAQLASSNGHARAIELKGRLTDGLTAAEVEQAQIRGKQWIKRREYPTATRLEEERSALQ